MAKKTIRQTDAEKPKRLSPKQRILQLEERLRTQASEHHEALASIRKALGVDDIIEELDWRVNDLENKVSDLETELENRNSDG